MASHTIEIITKHVDLASRSLKETQRVLDNTTTSIKGMTRTQTFQVPIAEAIAVATAKQNMLMAKYNSILKPIDTAISDVAMKNRSLISTYMKAVASKSATPEYIQGLQKEINSNYKLIQQYRTKKEIGKRNVEVLSESITPKYISNLKAEITSNSKTVDNYKKMQKGGIQWVDTQKKVTKGIQAFRMEMLGVMFFGQNMARMFGQMTSGAMDWLGISELFQLGIDLIMFESILPFADSLYDAATKLIDFSQNMDPVVKGFFGIIAVSGQATGMIMQFAGSLILGLTSLVMAFPAVSNVAAPAIGTLVLALGTLLGTISDGNAILSTAAVTFGTIGATIAALPFTEALGDIPLVGDAFKSLGPLAMGAFGGIYVGGVTMFDALTSASNAMKDNVTGHFGMIKSIAEGVTSQTYTVEVDTEAELTELETTADKLKGMGFDVSLEKISEEGKTAKYKITIKSDNTIIDMNLDNTIKKVDELLSKLKQTGINVTGGETKFVSTTTTVTSTRPESLGAIETMFKYIGIKPPSSGVSRQYGGMVPGRLGEPIPIIAHGGEKFEGIHGEGGEPIINLSVSYNIQVSDRREMENLIHANNDDLVAELKRMVK